MTTQKERAASARRTARECDNTSNKNDTASDHRGQGVALLNRCNTEPPEFGISRRAFLIYAFACGLVKPERVVERIVAEIEEDV